eukprot:4925-Chlamydomonas_euryale.AAC.6
MDKSRQCRRTIAAVSCRPGRPPSVRLCPVNAASCAGPRGVMVAANLEDMAEVQRLTYQASTLVRPVHATSPLCFSC